MSADRTRPRFAPDTDPVLLDDMLGKLAVYLRMCGYDAMYVGDGDAQTDDAIRRLADEAGRVLLTRDVALVNDVEAAVLLTEREPADQLDELRAAGFELGLPEEPRRCGRCNGALEAVPDGDERPDYAPPPDEFDCWRCVDCGQFFWKGSHWDRVGSLL